MNILYFHANLLRDTYRCRQVRARLLGFISGLDIDVLFISGVNNSNLTGFLEFKQKLTDSTMPIIDKAGSYRIHDRMFKVDDLSMVIDGKRFIPLDGSVLMIESEPEIKGDYIALDLFADENFAAYHSEMDAQTLLELRELIEGFPIQNKNHLN
ncbi:MAG: hypothetical protein E4G74_03555 [Erysipelotrichales bacterium]|nr:MAG: hypothetical protein E4G74_03555 [Erysipelotrichales bacterium]